MTISQRCTARRSILPTRSSSSTSADTSVPPRAPRSSTPTARARSSTTSSRSTQSFEAAADGVAAPGAADPESARKESGSIGSFWVSGPKPDRTDGRYTAQRPQIDPDMRVEYEAFLSGAALPGRERG